MAKTRTIDGVTFTDDTFWRAPGSLVAIVRQFVYGGELRPSGVFKLGHVVGYARTGKVKVRVWSSNSKCWSQPQYKVVDQLAQLDGSKLSARHRAVVKHARDNLLEASTRRIQ